LIYSQGRCSHTAKLHMEICTVERDADPTQVGSVFVDVIDRIDPALVLPSNFDTTHAATAQALSGTTEGRTQTAFARCAFDPARLTAALTDTCSTLAEADRMALIALDDTLLHSADVAALARAMGLTPP
jgi:hypothetical protein